MEKRIGGRKKERRKAEILEERRPDVITKLALQNFLKLRVGCYYLYYDTGRKITYPLSFTRYKWEKQPYNLEKKGGECWVQLSTNTDEEEEKQILDLKCPYDLPEFPQLKLTVKCPDNVEQCAAINFCNTESEATVKTPVNCDVMNIPHLMGYREPLHHNHHYYNNNNNKNTMMMMKEVVLEAEIVLTPPPSSDVNTVRLEVGTLDINNNPVGWIDFQRFPSLGGEYLELSCLQDYVGRVVTPWMITPSHNTISIILKITEWSIKIYQELEGDQQSLVADQQFPRGVGGFPYNQLNVWCIDGEYCGQVLSPPNITEYTKLSSTSGPVDIYVMEEEKQPDICWGVRWGGLPWKGVQVAGHRPEDMLVLGGLSRPNHRHL
ncbi:hypothetical protein Pmani_001958 [Petrolisthes manimaculis]|uniref:Uncharacterized protein n=1 Tax=Petrolisthes manimaculis TaxID=1843537 RepID=A0AAE1QJI0_9EUCA|nr:hypothetical protein Pmani_001958 [Petrolisthes manimaculis]